MHPTNQPCKEDFSQNKQRLKKIEEELSLKIKKKLRHFLLFPFTVGCGKKLFLSLQEPF